MTQRVAIAVQQNKIEGWDPERIDNKHNVRVDGETQVSGVLITCFYGTVKAHHSYLLLSGSVKRIRHEKVEMALEELGTVKR